jgi:hypothetical protein
MVQPYSIVFLAGRLRTCAGSEIRAGFFTRGIGRLTEIPHSLAV